MPLQLLLLHHLHLLTLQIFQQFLFLLLNPFPVLRASLRHMLLERVIRPADTGHLLDGLLHLAQLRQLSHVGRVLRRPLLSSDPIVDVLRILTMRFSYRSLCSRREVLEQLGGRSLGHPLPLLVHWCFSYILRLTLMSPFSLEPSLYSYIPDYK